MNNNDNIQEIAEDIAQEKEVRKAFLKFSDRLNERYRVELWSIYNDPKIAEAYRVIKRKNELETHVDRRQVIKFPNATVFQFLNDIFTPKYGKDWLQDKKILMKVMKREPLIKPWIVGKI